MPRHFGKFTILRKVNFLRQLLRDGRRHLEKLIFWISHVSCEPISRSTHKVWVRGQTRRRGISCRKNELRPARLLDPLRTRIESVCDFLDHIADSCTRGKKMDQKTTTWLKWPHYVLVPMAHRTLSSNVMFRKSRHKVVAHSQWTLEIISFLHLPPQSISLFYRAMSMNWSGLSSRYPCAKSL